MDHFFQQVYELVAQIPRGKLATYGQIAALLGRPRSAKIVGWAMRSAPCELDLPCHRVVSKSGRLAPDYAFGGAGKQRAMLAAEGITFKVDGCLDLDKHLVRGWPGKLPGDLPFLAGEVDCS